MVEGKLERKRGRMEGVLEAGRRECEWRKVKTMMEDKERKEGEERIYC